MDDTLNLIIVWLLLSSQSHFIPVLMASFNTSMGK